MKLSESNQRALDKREEQVSKRLGRSFGGSSPKPVIRGGNIRYEMAERTQAISCGGIGLIVQLVERLGLREEIDQEVTVLQRHLPYHESDHVLAIAFNILSGGSRLEDLEGLRRNVPFLDALGASRLPDPTTAGDFTRRFKEQDILDLMDAVNWIRREVWLMHRDGSFFRSNTGSGVPAGPACFKEAVLDIDSTIAETTGECKAGIGFSYNGKWGYGPLLISLANTGEPLYVVNRPGNSPSQADATLWLERAINQVEHYSERICLRGDSAFAMPRAFDEWSERGIDFVFSYDSYGCLVNQAQGLPEEAWEQLERPAKYEVATQPRKRPERAMAEYVRTHEYTTKRLKGEQVAEFPYRPGKCKRDYRVIAVRKNLSVSKGENNLLDEIVYFFYITNRTDLSAAEVVGFISDRCNQENLIEQMHNGVHALNMPVNNLLSNWAYMAMASLAWSLKAWYGLLMPNRQLGAEVMKMEFRRFLQNFILIPCQIVNTGRRLVYRVLGFNQWLGDWLGFSTRLQSRPRRC